MKRNILKSIFLCFAVVSLGLFVACNKEVTVKSINPVASTIPEEILTTEVGQALTSIQLEVLSSNGSKETINLAISMLSNEDISKLRTAGTHEITVTYEGVETKITVTIVAPEVDVPSVDGPEISFTLDIVEKNLKAGGTLPDEYGLYVWTWSDLTDGMFVPTNNGKFNAPEGYTGVVFIVMPVGVEPNWDAKIDQTFDLEIVDGVVCEIGGGADGGGSTIVTIEYTAETSSIPYNLKDGATMPIEYDLYAYVWGGKQSDIFIKVVDGKFTADIDTTGCCFVMMPVGTAPNWNDKLAQTVDYAIVWDDVKPYVYCGVETVVDMTTIAQNLTAEVTLPAEYDIYAFVSGGDSIEVYIPVVDGVFNSTMQATECKFVIVEKDLLPSSGTILAETTTYSIENTVATTK